ncbi:hypothetical protein SLEP1_g12293 [Rubroshorea leprosula]|uniref:Uncharacterized protein n=1 Tax=Rubroshorea leprosula TaxID=152421 RepID=A0AAV5IHY1_9ROSI|nr:hypothetical protein SLEP1_g12293 [Rubroshorea leprosula]
MKSTDFESGFLPSAVGCHPPLITLDGTKVDHRSVPKFSEIAKYCLSMAEKLVVLKGDGPKGF